jgi:signal transduction histidine kinase
LVVIGQPPGRVIAAHAPWSARAWRDTAFVASGAAMLFPVLIALAVPIFAVAGILAQGTAKWVHVLGALALAGAIAAVPAVVGTLTGLQRSRFRALAAVDIPPARLVTGRPHWRGYLAAYRSRVTWRQAGYHFLATPLVAVGGVLTLLMWAAGLASVGGALAEVVKSGVGHKARIVLPVLAIVFLVLAPWLAAGVAALDRRFALPLLGPSRAEELQRRVATLAESRAGVVDAADAERRRIERDLHDGAQRRLVSLAMNLGMARAELDGLPDDARRVIADAHEEAKEALAELRDLVRGLHPAILDDRGLDAALSGIAARSPVPVSLRVRLPERAPPTVEAVAYFVVSEALANIAKHSGAASAEVTVDRVGGRLRVLVTDDGVGSADPAGGTGLAGLARRAASVDGTFDLSSPPGGPTQITVEIPCES